MSTARPLKARPALWRVTAALFHAEWLKNKCGVEEEEIPKCTGRRLTPAKKCPQNAKGRKAAVTKNMIPSNTTSSGAIIASTDALGGSDPVDDSRASLN